MSADPGSFTAFAEELMRPLRQALIAGYGREAGDEALSEAMEYAWENWARVSTMTNPSGYLYRVGQSRARARFRRRGLRVGPMRPESGTYWFEPKLSSSMASLSRKQRTAVILVHGFDWTVTEVAEMWGVTFSTVQTHLDRGMSKLRRKLGVG